MPWMPCCCGTCPSSDCPTATIPGTVHATWTILTGSCACMNGLVQDLVSTIAERWQKDTTLCGSILNFRTTFLCGSPFVLQATNDITSQWLTDSVTVVSCDPLHIQFFLHLDGTHGTCITGATAQVDITV